MSAPSGSNENLESAFSTDVDSLLVSASEARSQGNYRGAMSRLRFANLQSPDDPQPLIGMAWVSLDLNNVDAATKYLGSALERTAASDRARMLVDAAREVIHLAHGRRDPGTYLQLAETCLTLALKYASKDEVPDLSVQLGDLQFGRGETRDGLMSYQRALARAAGIPGHKTVVVRALSGQTRCHLELGQYGDALRDANVLVQLAPEEARSWQLVGRALQAGGHYTGAIEAYGRAMLLGMRHPGLQTDMGWCYAFLGHQPEFLRSVAWSGVAPPSSALTDAIGWGENAHRSSIGTGQPLGLS